MTPQKNVQRNTVNEASVHFSDVAKSGFSLGYSSQISGTIGKLLPISTQWLMPGDRCSFGNTLKAQFEPLAVPMSGRLNLDSHNFYVKMRNIYGQDWMDFMAMHQGTTDVQSLPTFTLKGLMQAMPQFPVFKAYSSTAWAAFKTSVDSYWTPMAAIAMDFTTQDYLQEYRDAVELYMSGLTAPANADAYKEQVKAVLYLICDKLVGEGSYLDYFGYPIISHAVINKIVDGYTDTTNPIVWANQLSDMPFNDAPLRAMYYVWFVFYRNIYTEPKAKCINPAKWSATALPYATLWKLLVPRFRNWNIDMFTGAQIDDISRHVYAGIPYDGKNWSFNDEANNYSPVDVPNDAEMQAEGIVSQNLQYLDTDGSVKTINVSVPSMFGNSYLADSSTSDQDSMPGNLPLLQLRRAKFLEKYLKRVFYGGDLYTDYTKSIYGVDLSDALANQPQYLRGNSTACDVSQEVNNTSTAEMPAGTKTAVMAVDGNGDGSQFFADEFGLYLQIISFLPECSYDSMPNQLLYSKLMDFPIPQFSQQDDELSHRYEISRTPLASELASAIRPFAHHPYKHDWRGRVNDFHGNALSTRKMYNFGRLFDLSADATTPKLNASFLHCKPSLDMFISSSPLNDTWFGYADHEFFVERALTAFVEEI